MIRLAAGLGLIPRQAHERVMISESDKIGPAMSWKLDVLSRAASVKAAQAVRRRSGPAAKDFGFPHTYTTDDVAVSLTH